MLSKVQSIDICHIDLLNSANINIKSRNGLHMVQSNLYTIEIIFSKTQNDGSQFGTIHSTNY